MSPLTVNVPVISVSPSKRPAVWAFAIMAIPLLLLVVKPPSICTAGNLTSSWRGASTSSPALVFRPVTSSEGGTGRTGGCGGVGIGVPANPLAMGGIRGIQYTLIRASTLLSDARHACLLLCQRKPASPRVYPLLLC